MNWQKAKSEGDVCTTTLTGTRANVDRMVEIDRAVREHCYNHFDELLEAQQSALALIHQALGCMPCGDVGVLINNAKGILQCAIAEAEEVIGI